MLRILALFLVFLLFIFDVALEPISIPIKLIDLSPENPLAPLANQANISPMSKFAGAGRPLILTLIPINNIIDPNSNKINECQSSAQTRPSVEHICQSESTTAQNTTCPAMTIQPTRCQNTQFATISLNHPTTLPLTNALVSVTQLLTEKITTSSKEVCPSIMYLYKDTGTAEVSTSKPSYISITPQQEKPHVNKKGITLKNIQSQNEQKIDPSLIDPQLIYALIADLSKYKKEEQN